MNWYKKYLIAGKREEVDPDEMGMNPDHKVDPIVGMSSPNGDSVSEYESDLEDNVGYLGSPHFRLASMSGTGQRIDNTFGSAHWYFYPRVGVLRWWTPVDEHMKEIVKGHIKRKYGMTVLMEKTLG